MKHQYNEYEIVKINTAKEQWGICIRSSKLLMAQVNAVFDTKEEAEKEMNEWRIADRKMVDRFNREDAQVDG